MAGGQPRRADPGRNRGAARLRHCRGRGSFSSGSSGRNRKTSHRSAPADQSGDRHREGDAGELAILALAHAAFTLFTPAVLQHDPIRRAQSDRTQDRMRAQLGDCGRPRALPASNCTTLRSSTSSGLDASASTRTAAVHSPSVPSRARSTATPAANASTSRGRAATRWTTPAATPIPSHGDGTITGDDPAFTGHRWQLFSSLLT